MAGFCRAPRMKLNLDATAVTATSLIPGMMTMRRGGMGNSTRSSVFRPPWIEQEIALIREDLPARTSEINATLRRLYDRWIQRLKHE
jgi:hypothetical protein